VGDVILAVDGGNTKTELVVAGLDGSPIAYVRGPGSNSHGPGGAEGCVEVLAALVDRAAVDTPARTSVFYLCGADVPADVAALEQALQPRGWADAAVVDNDTFALLRAGTDAADAVAVVCGAGINCVARAADGRIARYPSLGWETGDWGGSEVLGREALFLAARGEDGRGAQTELTRLVAEHFGLPSAAAVGEAVHYGRLRDTQLGRLAPAVVDAAARGDAVARGLVERLAGEIALLVERAFRDLGLAEADVVLGGGMLREGGLVLDEVVARLPDGAHAARLVDPPVLGAALAALDLARAPGTAHDRLREAFRAGWAPVGG
jgi:N-acetylglucosamine kinase-like BadF-type ATPase